MATPAKRPREENEPNVDQNTNDSVYASNKSDCRKRAAAFLKWFSSNADNYFNEKVTIGPDGSCAQNGMVALSDIDEGECLFRISRKILLHPKTCSISELLEEDPVNSESGWSELLISMMHEYNAQKSQWKLYFDVLPESVDLPMFWTKEEREPLLTGTGVVEAVNRDINKIHKEFEAIVSPYIKKHKDIISPGCDDIDLYKKMVSYVMAYSFTEPPKDDDSDDLTEEEEEEEKSIIYMVPMADMLNHIAKNNAHLSFKPDCLEMISTKAISKGEEVFNTYGELANWHLLHMYGFSEAYPENHYDTVDMPLDTVLDIAEEETENKEFAKKKSSFFKQKLMEDLIGDVVVGTSGILTDDRLFLVLKVMEMTPSQFAIYEEECEEGWEEDLEEDTSVLADFEKMKDLSQSWKTIISRSASTCLKRYNTSMQEDEEKLMQIKTLNSRQQHSLYLCYGQKMLLQKLINACR
ncbi:N-lysine methyltransferase setd6-like [Saccostrea echinata]|uniref:N-lysine methyltransferase setd6-like n=1 Tax=Saccostrea echinata TaxID=191078 RepID=UPI002A822997|nr:N-lysine methyltransferase setd6-like [Saccostrea echinata]